MKNIKKVGLYSPYLDIFGGGEKHILSIIKMFDKAGFQIDLLWKETNIAKSIEENLGIKFQNLSVEPNFLLTQNPWQKILFTRQYNHFFYVTDGSYFFSQAQNNYIFAMVPQKKLYKKTLLNRLKWLNFKFISNSKFTQRWLKRWGITSAVIYPYIDSNYFVDMDQINKKEPIILLVGRFFPHLHEKNHELAIKLFNKIKKLNQFKEFKLYLVGRVKDEDQDYVAKIRSIASRNPDIFVLVNLSQKGLLEIYKKASIYWHFTGFGIDENIHPEKMEHLGIAPLEAMTSGAIVFMYRGGGVEEIIKDGINGFTFDSEAELINKMQKVNEEKSKKIISKSIAFVKKNFETEVFEKKVRVFFNI